MDQPISRQPVCRYCDHEDHVFTRCLLDLGGGATCPCPPKSPTGIYLEERTHG